VEQAAHNTAELEGVMQAFAGISDSLLSSYKDLAARAERVEQELELKVDELAATRAHLEAILEALPTGVVVRDAQGQITRVNPACRAILGERVGALLGRESHPALLGEQADGAARELERTDGKRIVVQSRHSSIVDAAGVETGSVEILDDRTELSVLTERLHRADKMAALGTMAGGIAHEIRNPMNAINGFAVLLKSELEDGTREHHWSTVIAEGVQEVERIITSMQTFAHPEQLCKDTIDPDELLASAVDSALQTLSVDADRSRFDITTECAVAPFLGDRIKMRQALRNLIANAIEAQGDSGRIHVDLRQEDGDVLLSVHDDGPGLPEELDRRVFDPFFTTRPEGTGLGLALVHTIAGLHGGRVEIVRDTDRAHPNGLTGADITLRIPFTAIR
jgi:signal transduction histidine kinase